MINNHLNSIGLGVLVTSAVIATSTFGYTMAQHPTATQGLTSPTLASSEGVKPAVKRVGDLAVFAAPTDSEIPAVAGAPIKGVSPTDPEIVVLQIDSTADPLPNPDLASEPGRSALRGEPKDDLELGPETAPLEEVAEEPPLATDIEAPAVPAASAQVAPSITEPVAVEVPREVQVVAESDVRDSAASVEAVEVEAEAVEAESADNQPEDGLATVLSLPQPAPTPPQMAPPLEPSVANVGNATGEADENSQASTDNNGQRIRNPDGERRPQQNGGNRRDQGGRARQRG